MSSLKKLEHRVFGFHGLSLVKFAFPFFCHAGTDNAMIVAAIGENHCQNPPPGVLANHLESLLTLAVVFRHQGQRIIQHGNSIREGYVWMKMKS